MRRFSSILLILTFWLGPLISLLPASEESRLPICCRRQGAHRCAMNSMAEPGSTRTKPSLSSPSHCPSYPEEPAASVTPLYALHAVSSWSVEQTTKSAFTASDRAHVSSSQPHTRADRGPPASILG
jgi:hypothetical protein